MLTEVLIVLLGFMILIGVLVIGLVVGFVFGAMFMGSYHVGDVRALEERFERTKEELERYRSSPGDDSLQKESLN